MSLLTRLLPTITNSLCRSFNVAPSAQMHSITQAAATNVSPGGLFSISVRNVIRCHFPRPSERKRIKRHGYKQRMKTVAGQRILMRAILKGRYVYSH